MNKLTLYRLTFYALKPLIFIYLKIRLRMGKEDPARIEERFGRSHLPRPAGSLVWVHCASVGETQSVLTVIDRILTDYPNVSVLLTTGTKTSAEFIAPRLHKRFFHQYVPIDHPVWVRNFLDHFRPNLALWVESELWPNLIVETKKSGIEIILLNARMSDASFQSWQKNPGFIRRVLSNFTLVLAQNQLYANYYAALGAPSVEISGNLKFAVPALPYNQADFQSLQTMIGSRPVWLAASTHEGEEKSIAETHRALRHHFPGLLTIVAPRHPHRAYKIMQEISAIGLNAAQRSQKQRIQNTTDIYLADTIGELGLFFALCRTVFMGGSYKTKGGHNLLEPARYGCAILHGPNMENFPDINVIMQQNSAAQIIKTDQELQSLVHRLLSDPQSAHAMGQRAAMVARGQDQVLNFVLSRIYSFMAAPESAPAVRYANA